MDVADASTADALLMIDEVADDTEADTLLALSFVAGSMKRELEAHFGQRLRILYDVYLALRLLHQSLPLFRSNLVSVVSETVIYPRSLGPVEVARGANNGGKNVVGQIKAPLSGLA